ncbi:MAG TPA: DUF2905 domain-containing protein [Sedimentisphaerales bacterium]|nr:DUF2905 domain-containing protein [Sedimentisphaerales bacterium]HRS09501.1 DUF2905 domain-containing protein [Sedimentisphaerales bacterium]HRV46198.1 DUF2905 domain-containing protein [Sedimentisphaerales bacterium]
MDWGPQQFGRWLVAVGVGIVAVGLLWMLLGRSGLSRLPGDLEFGGRNWRVYFPLGTCILLSLILTLVLWLIRYLRR